MMLRDAWGCWMVLWISWGFSAILEDSAGSGWKSGIHFDGEVPRLTNGKRSQCLPVTWRLPTPIISFFLSFFLSFSFFLSLSFFLFLSFSFFLSLLPVVQLEFMAALSLGHVIVKSHTPLLPPLCHPIPPHPLLPPPSPTPSRTHPAPPGDSHETQPHPRASIISWNQQISKMVPQSHLPTGCWHSIPPLPRVNHRRMKQQQQQQSIIENWSHEINQSIINNQIKMKQRCRLRIIRIAPGASPWRPVSAGKTITWARIENKKHGNAGSPVSTPNIITRRRLRRCDPAPTTHMQRISSKSLKNLSRIWKESLKNP